MTLDFPIYAAACLPALQQGSFRQLPLSIQATVILVTLGGLYFVWATVLRDRLETPLRVSSADKAALDALARTADFGDESPAAGAVLKRLDPTAPEDTFAFSAIQCHDRGLVAVSLQNQRWRSEIAVPYHLVGNLAIHQQKEMLGCLAAFLGPLALLTQTRLYYLDIAYRTPSGDLRQLILEGRKSQILRLKEFLATKCPVTPTNSSSSQP